MPNYCDETSDGQEKTTACFVLTGLHRIVSTVEENRGLKRRALGCVVRCRFQRFGDRFRWVRSRCARYIIAGIWDCAILE